MAVVFFEGSNGEQDGWPVTTQTTKNYDLTLPDQPVPNDEAKSCTLVDVKEGTVIEVFNSSTGDATKGAATIKVKQPISISVVIDSFQQDLLTEQVEMDYNDKGELDGKVSLIKITAG